MFIYRKPSQLSYLTSTTTFQTPAMPSPTNRPQQSDNNLSSRKNRFYCHRDKRNASETLVCLNTQQRQNDLAHDTNIILNATKFRQSEKGTANYTMSPYNFDMSLLTLAHNRRKIGPEFRSIQRAAITLGVIVADHLTDTDHVNNSIGPITIYRSFC